MLPSGLDMIPQMLWDLPRNGYAAVSLSLVYAASLAYLWVHLCLLLQRLLISVLADTKKAAVRLLSEPAGARTQDPILKRDVLYLLSY